MQLGTYVTTYEIADMVFFIKSINSPSEKFNILDYVDFSAKSTYIKLYHKTASTNCIMNTFTQIMKFFTNNIS